MPTQATWAASHAKAPRRRQGPSAPPLFVPRKASCRLDESPGAGPFGFCAQEDSMFEGQPQTELDALIQGNSEFKQLYQRHKQLDKQVLDAELGVLPVDDATLTQMKREKLAAKDRLTRLYDVLHH
jgi:uncharacterized protein YdcH (DUF465 family)